MKIATVQMPMAYTIIENVETILSSLTQAKVQGAEVAVFPECAVIGYHREMGSELTQENIENALTRISQKCAALGIAAVVGTPFYGDGLVDKPWSAVAIFTHLGELAAIFPKLIFTRTEKYLDLFTVGKPASRQCFQLFGRTCAVLICCELCGEFDDPREHYQDIMPTLDAKPEIVFVPAIFDMDESGNDKSAMAARTARRLARDFQTSVVVANWPEWGGPAPTGFLGGSLTVDTQGTTLCQARPNEPDIVIVDVL